MLVEVDLKKAISYLQDGRKVLVLDEDVNGRYNAYPLETLFGGLTFLADVPAVGNPEFEQAVNQMIDDRNPEPPKPEPPEPEPSGKKPPKQYSVETKAEALRMIAEGARPVDVCRKLGVSDGALYSWRHPEKFRKKKKPEAANPEPDTEPPG